MKKIFTVLIVSALIISMSACAKTKSTDTDSPVSSPAATEATADGSSKSEDKAVKDENNVSNKENAESDISSEKHTNTVYWATKDKDSSDVAYHTKDCKIIKDKEPQELSWEIIDTLGMPECEVCKPNSK